MSSPSVRPPMIYLLLTHIGSADRRTSGARIQTDSLQAPSVCRDQRAVFLAPDGIAEYLSVPWTAALQPRLRTCGSVKWRRSLLRVARVWRRERTLPSGSGQLRLGTDREATVWILCTLRVCFLFAVWPLASPQRRARSPASSTYQGRHQKRRACMYTERTLFWPTGPPCDRGQMSNTKGGGRSKRVKPMGAGPFAHRCCYPATSRMVQNQTPRRSAPTHDDSFKPAGEGGAVV